MLEKVLAAIATTALAALVATGPATGRVGEIASAETTCAGPPDVAAIIAQARADGFTIAPGALEALKSVPDVATGPQRILVGTKATRVMPSPRRSIQSAARVAAGDVASLGCPVGDAAHVNWDSGSGLIQEYWKWATIGGQTGTSSPAPGYCYQVTCRWYAWASGVQNRYYRSVSVYNGWYAFIRSAGCGF